VAGGRETVVITREGKPDVALVDATGLDDLREHPHVLTPLERARALAEALAPADRGEWIRLTPEALRALADEAERDPHRIAAALAEPERAGRRVPVGDGGAADQPRVTGTDEDEAARSASVPGAPPRAGGAGPGVR
jgi:hypothetical protein